MNIFCGIFLWAIEMFGANKQCDDYDEFTGEAYPSPRKYHVPPMLFDWIAMLVMMIIMTPMTMMKSYKTAFFNIHFNIRNEEATTIQNLMRTSHCTLYYSFFSQTKYTNIHLLHIPSEYSHISYISWTLYNSFRLRKVWIECEKENKIRKNVE